MVSLHHDFVVGGVGLNSRIPFFDSEVDFRLRCRQLLLLAGALHLLGDSRLTGPITHSSRHCDAPVRVGRTQNFHCRRCRIGGVRCISRPGFLRFLQCIHPSYIPRIRFCKQRLLPYILNQDMLHRSDSSVKLLMCVCNGYNKTTTI